MDIKDNYKDMIEDRLNENGYHMEDNKIFLKVQDEHDVLYKKLEENLQEKDKKLLAELNSKTDRIKLEENCLSYIIGLSDGIKLRNTLDVIV